MKLFSLVSFVLLLCCASPLRAADKDAKDADHADVRIDPLPAGWTGNDMGNGVYLATSNVDASMFQVNSSYHDANFEAFCKIMIDRDTSGSDLKDRKATDPHLATIGPPGTLEYDVTGKEGDNNEHIHIYLMPVRKTYCFIKCWCDAADWDKYKPVFEQVAKNAK
jgi:hypothetical protein